MNKLRIGVATVLTVSMMAAEAGGGVSVRGYYRSDGTYVQPHVRSAPNATRSDNYGRSDGSALGRITPYGRDADRDGLSNDLDIDDDGDGWSDDYDRD